MKIIINGDDLGYTSGINQGMVIGATRGILRSTTAVMNGAYIKEGVEMMKEHPEIGVGLHLNLTLGKPLTHCPSLTNPSNSVCAEKIPVGSGTLSIPQAEIIGIAAVSEHLPRQDISFMSTALFCFFIFKRISSERISFQDYNIILRNNQFIRRQNNVEALIYSAVIQ